MTPEELQQKQENKKFNFVVKFRLMVDAVDALKKWIEKHDAEAIARHEKIDGDLKRIELTLAKLPCETELVKIRNVEARIDMGAAWKLAIILALIGLLWGGYEAVLKFGQIIAVVERNTARILHIEDMLMEKHIFIANPNE